VYSGFFVDRIGRLWLRDPFPYDGPLKLGWTVFTDDGTLLGRYEPPDLGAVRTMVTDAGRDFVVLRVRSQEEGIRVLVQGIAPAR
jgi:hypothetical protein